MSGVSAGETRDGVKNGNRPMGQVVRVVTEKKTRSSGQGKREMKS